MATRSFKQMTVTLAGTPQPLVGTRITASTVPSGGQPDGTTYTSLPVADSSMFKPGDYAQLLTISGANYINIERLFVSSVPDATHIIVKNMQFNRVGGVFGTGDFVVLSICMNSVYVQTTAGNAGLLYVGNLGLKKAGLVNVVATLFNVAAGQPIDFSDARTVGPNGGDACEWWIDGTTNDTYLPSFGVM